MKTILSFCCTFILISFSSLTMAAIQLTGAGSTFVYPILSRWATIYKQHSGTAINYQAIGSGGGIQQLTAHTIDFAAVDMPLTTKALAQHQWQQFPLISGGMVIVINLPNIKNNQLILDGRTLAAIYAGKITHWKNPRIVKLNPRVKLPHVTINVLHRADGSGTTYNFTHYLAQVSPNWKQHIGVGTTVAWPVGIGAKGNSGVAMFAQRVIGSIGYVEYSYAKLTKLNTVRMKNSAGNIVSPTPQTFQAAAKNARWHAAKNYHILLTNQSGKNSWPLVATTFLLLPTHPKNITKQKAFITFLKWCYAHGTSSARKLDYVPLPNNTVHL